jgi:hypothetical protein
MEAATAAGTRLGWALSAVYLRHLARPRLDSPDRHVLEERIFPALYRDRAVRRILFVGVSRYTRWYPALFRTRPGVAFETADPRADAAPHGARGAHWRSRFEALREHRPPYDVIVLNGIFEYGTDTDAAKARSIVAAREMLRGGGRLVLGYRERQPHPDIDLEAIGAAGFEPAAVPGLGTAYYRTEQPNGHTYAGFLRP